MEMPWPPGEETLTLSEFAGATAIVDVMDLTSMWNSNSQRFFTKHCSDTHVSTGSGGWNAAVQVGK
jgi:hypothetical protein